MPAGGTLQFGDLAFPGQVGAAWIDALGSDSGTSWGAAEPLVQTVDSFLQDGAVAVTRRYGTRDLTLRLRIKAMESGGLAAAEALLVAEVVKSDPLEGTNLLTWTPKDGFGPPSVFEVVAARLDHSYDDLAEVGYSGTPPLYRYYNLTLTALPSSRSTDAVTVVVPAPPASFTEVLIDDCSSTTGWSGSPNAPILDSGTVVEDKVGRGGLSGTVTLIRSGLSASLATTPYVRVTAAGRQSALPNAALSFKLNGNQAAVLASSGNTYWLDGTGLGTLISVEISASVHNGYLYVDSISRTNSTTTGSTGRQNARQIEVAGSARAQASLSLADETSPLGTVLVHTTSRSDSVQPPLRTWLVAGPTETSDGTVVSGKTSNLSTVHHLDVPITGLPAGGYLLLARVKHASAGNRAISWSAVSRMSGANTGDTETGTTTINLAADTWKVVTVATLTLPPTQTGPNGVVRIDLSGPSGLLLDEAWLFDVEHGHLTQVDCTTSKYLWLDTASLNDPSPSIWRGNNADRSDAVHAGPDTSSWGMHEFVPPLVSVFTVTTESTAAALALTAYPRWHTHAGL